MNLKSFKRASIVGFLLFILGGVLNGEIVLTIVLPRQIESDQWVFAAIQTQKEFEEELIPRYHRLVLPTPRELEKRELTIVFENLESGNYVVSAFLDRDKNERLTTGMFGPTEPWDMVNLRRPLLGPPRFQDLSLEIPGHGSFTLTLR